MCFPIGPIVHRDIKPANIMIERKPDGALHPVVMDFGLAHDSSDGGSELTQSGVVMGTAAYMSPEQASGNVHSLDRRTDVYSLGATLYELLGGHPPFHGGPLMELLLRVMNEEPESLRKRQPRLPPDLDTIVMKALSKEPERRYESARAFAEDLQRYIEGEPIHGRPISLLYRFRRRARQKRGLLASMGISLLCLIALGGYSVRVRWNVRRQAQLAQAQAQLARELGQDLKEMEWFLRTAYVLPLHNVEPEQAMIRARLAQIETRLRSYGEQGVPLAHCALGRGYLALHEPEAALAHLQLATRSPAEAPEVYYALGAVLGSLYDKGMAEARRNSNREQLEKRRQELKAQYLDPALTYLQKSPGALLDSPEYLEGLIAFYSEQYDVALTKAGQAYARAPWLYEAKKLAGDAYQQLARHQLDTGHPAAETLRHAIAEYQQAAEAGRSDATMHYALAVGLNTWIEFANSNLGDPTKSAVERALAASDSVLRAAPSQPAGDEARTVTYYLLATNLYLRNSDPRAVVEQAIPAAEAWLKRSPQNLGALQMIGWLKHHAGQYELSHGQDAEQSLARSLSAFHAALAIDPRYISALDGITASYTTRALFQATKGEDPESDFKRSLQYANQLLDSTRGTAGKAAFSAYVTVLVTYNLYGEYLLSRGKDFQSLRVAVEQVAAECVGQNPKLVFCYFQLGSMSLLQSYQALNHGQEVSAYVQKAIANFSRAQELSPKLGDVYPVLARAHLVQARSELRRGHNPSASLAKVAEVTDKCRQLDPQDSDCAMIAAERTWHMAQWLKRDRPGALRSLQQGLALAQQAVQLAPGSADAYQLLAETHYRLARWQKGREHKGSLDAGVLAVARALERNPNLAEGLATQAALQLLAADEQRGPARQALAEKATATLQRALARNPGLSLEYAPLLAEATALAGLQP